MTTIEQKKERGVDLKSFLSDFNKKQEVKRGSNKVTSPPPKISKRKVTLKSETNLPPIKRENSDFQEDTRFKFVDTKRIETKDILFDFISWTALPKQERKPPLQKDFAENHGLHYNTLSAWKGLSGFWDEVKVRRNVLWRRYTNRVFYNGIVKPALDGNVKAAELFAKMFEGYNDKINIEQLVAVPEITQQENDLIANALKNIGLASIISFNQDDTEK